MPGADTKEREAWIDETWVNRGLERDRHMAERELLAVAAGPAASLAVAAA